jgi:hypothetical protein
VAFRPLLTMAVTTCVAFAERNEFRPNASNTIAVLAILAALQLTAGS